MVNQDQIEMALALKIMRFEKAFGPEVAGDKAVFMHKLVDKMNDETRDEFMRRVRALEI